MQCRILFVRVAGGAAELEVERVGEINSRSCAYSSARCSSGSDS